MAVTAGDWPLVPGARALARIPATTISATGFSTALPAGAEIATISTNLPGAVVDSVFSTDGSVVLSDDKTKLVRGASTPKGSDVEVTLLTSHPRAINSPRATVITLSVSIEVAPPAGYGLLKLGNAASSNLIRVGGGYSSPRISISTGA